MKTFPGYTDPFMSPVSGLVHMGGKQSLYYNYIWVGNRDNVAIESPALIDLRLEVIHLRKRLNNTPFIIQYPSPDFYNAQALSEVSNGLIANLNGVIVQATLAENNLWIGDSNNIPQAVPIIQVGNLPNLTHNYFWIGDASNRPIESNVLPVGTLPDLPYQNIWIGDVTNRPVANQRIGLINLPPFLSALPVDPFSTPPGAPVNFGLYNLYTGGLNPSVSEPIAPTTTLKIDKSNLPNLSKGKIWMGVINSLPPSVTFLPDPPYVEITGDLNWDVRGELPLIGDSYAVPQEVGLLPYELFTGDPLTPGQIIPVTVLDISNLPNLTFNKIWIGNNLNRPVEGTVPQEALPDLPFQNVWIGDNMNRPAPSPTIEINNLPDLPLNNFWLGNSLSRPVAVPFNIMTNVASGITGGPITNGTGTIGLSNTGVVPGAYSYASLFVNAQGRLTFAANNLSTIQEMMDNIANNATNIANNTTAIANNATAISTLNKAVFGTSGLVAAVANLNNVVFGAFGGIGLVAQITSNTEKIDEIINASDAYIGQIEENTGNIAGLGAAVGALSDQVDENTTNIALNAANISLNTAAINNILNDIIPSLPVRAACRVATTANLTATYNNGSSGVGATLTNSGTQAPLEIDGITLSTGRVLVKDQINEYENGIYDVIDPGSGSTNWILQRSPDFNGSPEGAIAEGVSLWISAGTINEETFWMQTEDGPFTVGTTPIVFSGYPGQDSITKVGTLTQGTWNADPVEVPFGGTGKTSFTPYTVICAGTTSTGDFQNVASVGDAGQVLTSQGPGALPVWEDPQEAIIVNQTISSVTMVAGRQYFINNGDSLVSLTLPLAVSQGDTFIVVGGSIGGWRVVPSFGHYIYFNSKVTSLLDGEIRSTNQYNCVTIKCILVDSTLDFVVTNSSGALLIG